MNAGNTPVALTLAVLSEGGGERESSGRYCHGGVGNSPNCCQ